MSAEIIQFNPKKKEEKIKKAFVKCDFCKTTYMVGKKQVIKSQTGKIVCEDCISKMKELIKE